MALYDGKSGSRAEPITPSAGGLGAGAEPVHWPWGAPLDDAQMVEVGAQEKERQSKFDRLGRHTAVLHGAIFGKKIEVSQQRLVLNRIATSKEHPWLKNFRSTVARWAMVEEEKSDSEEDEDEDDDGIPDKREIAVYEM